MSSLFFNVFMCSLFFSLVIARVLKATRDPVYPPILTIHPSPPSTLNYSTTLVNSTVKDVLLQNQASGKSLFSGRVSCDGSRFGHPTPQSCADAYSQIPQDRAIIIADPTYCYGQRGHGFWDVSLPKRYISMDGLCTIDLTQSSEPSYVRQQDLLTAGALILSECLEAPDLLPWGGQASGMGLEANFEVTVQAYQPPHIRCTDAAPAARPVSAICKPIIDTMNASTAQIIFGARGVVGVQQYLPVVLTILLSQCAIHIDITAPDDTVSWYDLWQAAVALDGMCARPGKTGKARFLGENRRIVMEIKKE